MGTVYRPPGTDVECFNNHISDLLQKINSEGKLVYIMGDFNINLLNIDKHLRDIQGKTFYEKRAFSYGAPFTTL